MKQNKRVAVTGGIGSGKSALLAIFREMGYFGISCDEVSAQLWQDETYRSELAKIFPSCVCNGAINKSVLSALVFSDERSRAKLNEFSHPYILNRVLQSMTSELCFAEVPLLFEGGYEKLFDAVIAVRRAREERIAAVQSRSGLSRQEIERRINCQFDESKLEEKRCFIVQNDGDMNELRAAAQNILAALTR